MGDPACAICLTQLAGSGSVCVHVCVWGGACECEKKEEGEEELTHTTDHKETGREEENVSSKWSVQLKRSPAGQCTKISPYLLDGVLLPTDELFEYGSITTTTQLITFHHVWTRNVTSRHQAHVL